MSSVQCGRVVKVVFIAFYRRIVFGLGSIPQTSAPVPLLNRRPPSLSTTMPDSRITSQEFQPMQRSKRKRGSSAAPDGASTSFLSPIQYAVLSDSEPEDQEETNITLPDSPVNKKRLPRP